ncbi:MAG: DUF983 domain-containing protein [Flavobacteriales bacterium]|nr:DUF983 domain-containing protein [Flavobacteriales bacterium]
MIKKGTKLFSILKFKCPTCHEGDFFLSHPYNLKKIGDLHTKCSKCGLKFSKEPGFYFGAMYVSYGLGIAIFVAVFVANSILNLGLSLFNMFMTVGVILFASTPYLFHLSKIIWANIFFHYKGN